MSVEAGQGNGNNERGEMELYEVIKVLINLVYIDQYNTSHWKPMNELDRTHLCIFFC